MKKSLPIITLVIWIIIWMFFSWGGGDYNSKLEYWSTGLPKNCRAIIKANIDDYNNWKFKAEDIIDSINRNCGENGYSWKK